ncbi:MAG: hypothetical protein ACK5HT_00990 [Draconibacterium sp.]
MNQEVEIRFETKEQANQRRIQETLERSPHERFLFFLQLCEEMQFFHTQEIHPNRKKNNFVLE